MSEANARAFSEHSDYVARMLRRYGVLGTDLEDLTQDVFLVACRRWSDYRTDEPLRPWLAGIAFNLARKHRARAWREVPAGEVEPEDQGPPPDEGLEQRRSRRLVLRALAKLRPGDRAILTLTELDGLSMREVAASLGVPLFTAYTRLRRARLRFAAVVAQLQNEAPVEERRWALVAVG